MGSISSSLLPASSEINAFNTLNLDLTLADTEYTLTIPAEAKQATIQARGQTTLKIAETSGGTTTKYITLRPFVPYNMQNLSGSSTIIMYVSSSKPAQVLELIYWY